MLIIQLETNWIWIGITIVVVDFYDPNNKAKAALIDIPWCIKVFKSIGFQVSCYASWNDMYMFLECKLIH